MKHLLKHEDLERLWIISFEKLSVKNAKIVDSSPFYHEDGRRFYLSRQSRRHEKIAFVIIIILFYLFWTLYVVFVVENDRKAKFNNLVETWIYAQNKNLNSTQKLQTSKQSIFKAS